MLKNMQNTLTSKPFRDHIYRQDCEGKDQSKTQTVVLSWWREGTWGTGRGSEVLVMCFCPTGGENMGILFF